MSLFASFCIPLKSPFFLDFHNMLFILQTQVVSLEDAARLLLGDSKDASKLKSEYAIQWL
jgi:hypothetical protein